MQVRDRGDSFAYGLNLGHSVELSWWIGRPRGSKTASLKHLEPW